MTDSKRIQARLPQKELDALDKFNIQQKMELYHRLGHEDFVLMYGKERVPQSNEHHGMEDFKAPDGKIYRSVKYWHDKARLYIHDSGLENYLRTYGIRYCPPELEQEADKIMSKFDWPTEKDLSASAVLVKDLNKVPYPDGNPKTQFGITKPRDTHTPPIPYLEYSKAHLQGALKYGPFNWRDDPITISTYLDAAISHILKFRDGNDRASDTNIHELGHAMTCLSIIIDAQYHGTITDDRWVPRDPSKHPNHGKVLEDYIEKNQDHIKAIREKWTNFRERFKAGEVDKNGDPIKKAGDE